MRPPSRRRVKPSRYTNTQNTAHKRNTNVRLLCVGWSRQEQREFLRGLRQQSKVNDELDLISLQNRVPKRSLQEIESLTKALKERVARRVFLQVHKQHRQDRRTKVPIEFWADLAHRMAGSHEDTISSAFSQMLVIAATEPLSLIHSDPPRPINAPATISTSLFTVPLKHLPKSKLQSGVSTSPSSQNTLHVGTAHNCASSQLSVTGAETSSSSAVVSSVTNTSKTSDPRDCHKGLLSGSVLANKTESMSVPSTLERHAPKYPTSSSQTVAKPTQPTHIQNSASTGSTSSQTPRPNHQSKHTEHGQSSHDGPLRPKGSKGFVDFDKVYRFLSTINNTAELPLSAMESAVMLDLLMSLPEELPLLDCKELQHHLLQVHARLTTPADVPNTTLTLHQNSLQSASAAAALQGNEMEGSTAPDGLRRAATTPCETQGCQTDKDAEKQNDASNQMNSSPGSVQPNNLGIERCVATESTIAPPDTHEALGQSCVSNWETIGLCPLNPFMVPVTLLARQESKVL